MFRWIKKKCNQTPRKMDALESLSNLRAAGMAENEYHIYQEIPEYGLEMPSPTAEDATDCPVCRYSPQDDVPCVCQDTKVSRSNSTPKTSSSTTRHSVILEVSSKNMSLHGNRKYNHANRPLPEIPMESSTTPCNRRHYRNSADLSSCDSNSMSSLDIEIDTEILRLDNLYMNVPEYARSLYMNSAVDKRHSVMSTDSGFGEEYGFSERSSVLSSYSSLSSEQNSCLEEVIYENVL